MVATAQRPRLVVIVGPTASGKSDLAMRVACDFRGEIISADSLTIYKGMDIGTAKPTKADRAKIKHWGLDLVGPGHRFTAAEFKRYAEEKIADIRSRGRLPIVVGGTGLYIDSLIFNFGFGADIDLRQRQKLEKLNIIELQNLIKKRGYTMPTNSQNRRYLIRIIERQGDSGTKTDKLCRHTILIGLIPANETLKKKIHNRVEKMFKAGLIEETTRLIGRYGNESLVFKAKVAYGPAVEYLLGESSLEEAKMRLETAHWQYARRQKTWFRRNEFIHWFGSTEAAFSYIKSQLNT